MFDEWITRLYKLRPHAIMPAPLSSVEEHIGVCNEHLRYDREGEIAAAVVASDSNVELIWAREGYLDPLADLLIEAIGQRKIKFLAINRTRYPIDMESLGFEIHSRYFRLIHKERQNRAAQVPQGFQFKDYMHYHDDRKTVDFVEVCYADQGIAISSEGLAKLRGKRFFDPDLWFWIVESDSGIPCALAISHYDAETGEGWLDWIQVIPEFRGRGLGQMLVAESISRLGNAEMITVSGNMENPHEVLKLYMKCGFDECQEWSIMERWPHHKTI